MKFLKPPEDEKMGESVDKSISFLFGNVELVGVQGDSTWSTEMWVYIKAQLYFDQLLDPGELSAHWQYPQLENWNIIYKIIISTAKRLLNIYSLNVLSALHVFSLQISKIFMK